MPAGRGHTDVLARAWASLAAPCRCAILEVESGHGRAALHLAMSKYDPTLARRRANALALGACDVMLWSPSVAREGSVPGQRRTEDRLVSDARANSGRAEGRAVEHCYRPQRASPDASTHRTLVLSPKGVAAWHGREGTRRVAEMTTWVGPNFRSSLLWLERGGCHGLGIALR
jgi:hypothetical protein